MTFPSFVVVTIGFFDCFFFVSLVVVLMHSRHETRTVVVVVVVVVEMLSRTALTPWSNRLVSWLSKEQ